MKAMPSMRFTGTVVRGLGIGGTRVRIPTINIEVACVPAKLSHGVYAGKVLLQGHLLSAAIHYGPRPAVKAPESFEIHVLDTHIVSPPKKIEIEILQRLRDIKDFPSMDALREAIANDVKRTREIVANASPGQHKVG